MADGYRYPQQSPANYYYPSSTQPQHQRHQIIRNSTPPNTGRPPFSVDTPSPVQTPDPHSPAHNIYGMYNQGHQQGQHGRVNGGGRGLQQQQQQQMGIYGGFQHQNGHQQHLQHHGTITQDHNTHTANGSAMGHHPPFSASVLSSSTPVFTPSGTASLQNGHPRTHTTHNEHWQEQQRLRHIAQEAHTAMIEGRQPHYYARTKAHDNRAIAHPAAETVARTHAGEDGESLDENGEEQTRISNFADVSTIRQDWTKLDMSGNSLRVLNRVFQYNFLTELYIASNKITELPAEIGQLRSMMLFDASHNLLKELPSTIGMCVMLKALLVFDNQIQTLPVELGFLYQLETLGIDGNPLEESIKTMMIEQGTKSLIHQYRESAPVPMPPPPRNYLSLTEDTSMATQERFKIFSYNILCDNATRQQYNYTPSAALAWDFRKDQILQEILSQDADIVCLQEVDIHSYKEFFAPKLAYNEFKGVFWPKARATNMTEENAKVVDGCATFYRNDRFLLLHKENLYFSQIAVHEMDMKGPDASDIYNRIMPKDQMAVLTFLEHRRAGYRLMVANGHLFWDPQFPDVKLIQSAIIMDRVAKFGEKWCSSPPTKDKDKKVFKLADSDAPAEPIEECAPSEKYESRTQIPFVMCIDLNSTPDSSAYEFLTQGHISPDHIDLRGRKYGEFSKSGIDHSYSLRSAYSNLDGTPDKLAFTNYTPGFVGVIDHIFYSTNSLEATKLLSGVDAEYMKMVPGFPNYHFPSDHLSLFTEFAVKPRPKEKKTLREPDFGSSSGRRGRND